MSIYPATCHTSKMTKIQNKKSVSKSLNYDSDKIRTKESFDLAKQEKYETQDSVYEPVKDINNYIKYMNNEAKVYDEFTKKYLITSLNCDDTLRVNEEFRQVEQLYHSHKSENLSKDKKPNEAFRLYINFNGHNIKAHKVHEISTEIAKRICGNEYKALISTHTNTDNYHSHILINAYNNDGWHKLKEELKIGLKWQRISNMVALENGCDILMTFNDKENIENNEEDIELPKPKYRTRKELQASYKNKLGKDILMHDIAETLKNPNIKNWQQYVKEMQNKGWQFDKNKSNTIIYYKQNFMTKTVDGYMRGFIRESRLGMQFTKSYIEKYLKSKQEEYYIFHKIQKVNYYKITPFLNDKIVTNRTPMIFRLIKMMINLVKDLIDNEYELIKKNPQQEFQIKENTILLKAKLKQLEKIKDKLDKYNLLHPSHTIENYTDLKVVNNNLLKRYKICENELKNYDKIKNINSILDSIKEIEENKDLIEKYNLYDILYTDINDININENLAKLDPMQPKTKSRLYNALHNSNYILTTTFNQLTETKAKEIIYFLSNEKKESVGQIVPQTKSVGIIFPQDNSQNNKQISTNVHISRGTNCPTNQSRGNNIPTEIIPKNQYKSYKNKLNEQKRTKNNDNLIQEQKKYENFKSKNNITDEEYDKIMKFKKHIYKLKSFGIDNLNKIDNVKNILQNRINILNETKESFDEIKVNLKLFNQLESYFDNNLNNKYFKPILNVIDENTFNNLKEYFIKKFNTTTEQILAVSKLIKNNIDLTNIENQILPTTEQKLCIALISKLSGNEYTENMINEMSLSDVKNMINRFLNTYTPEILNNMAKEYFEKEKQDELKEIQKIIEEENEYENTKQNNENENNKNKKEKINFYDFFNF